MTKRSLTTAVTMAAILGFGISLSAHAASHMMPGKPGSAMLKDGGKDGGGKEGGKPGKDKIIGPSDSRANMGGAMKGSQMRDMGK